MDPAHGLGGRISSGNQWISWVHIDDFIRPLKFVLEQPMLEGMIQVISPNPIRNREMMSALRRAFHRRWSLSMPKAFVHLGIWLMGSDPALALLGRRGLPRRLLDVGVEFTHPTLADAVDDLLEPPSR